jgi:hypothetical protein
MTEMKALRRHRETTPDHSIMHEAHGIQSDLTRDQFGITVRPIRARRGPDEGRPGMLV